jgi:hypothetical protein
MPRLAVISGFDSQFKWGADMARRFSASGWDVEFCCPQFREAQISQEQLESVRIPFAITHCSLAEVLDSELLLAHDAVLFSTQGGFTEYGLMRIGKVIRKLEEQAIGRRPVFVVGFVGVNYENRIGAVACRRAADIVIANSETEREFFESIAHRLNFQQPRFVNGGLGLISRRDDIDQLGAQRKQPAGAAGRTRVLFAAQPTVPMTKVERVYLLRRLRQLALARPDYEVVIKPRSRVHEQTFHREQNHLAPLLDEFFVAEHLPLNLTFDYRPIQEQLLETALCLTVSSTAAVEAHAFGVPFGIISDFGIKEPYGAEFFSDSGAMCTFDELERGLIPRASDDWIARNVAYGDECFGAVLKAVEDLLGQQGALGRPLPLHEDAYDAARLSMAEFTELWRRSSKKVDMVKKLTSGEEYCPELPKPGLPASKARHAIQRKLRKLVRRPAAFFADSKILKGLPLLRR